MTSCNHHELIASSYKSKENKATWLHLLCLDSMKIVDILNA